MSEGSAGQPMLVDLPFLRRFPPLGLHPLRIAHYVAFMLARRVHERVLRASYGRRIASGRRTPEMVPPPVRLGSHADLPAKLRPAARQLRDEADAILEHRVDYLGSGTVELGPAIDWHRDFKSGYRWEPLFYMDLEVTRLDDDSDAKVPWELSRGHQLLTLARAACLFDDERYAVEMEGQISSWRDANPPGFGINWVNAMEVGIRAVNWLWAIGTLEEMRPLDPALRARVSTSLKAHGRHIAMNLEGSPFLRSNHYLSDLLGLVAIAACLPKDRAARRWGRSARRRLEREIQSEVFADGVGFEASLPYHGLVLEIFLVSLILGRHGGIRFSKRFVERIGRMLGVSAAVRHPGGRTPIFGDNDSGRVLPAGFARPPSHDHLLWIGGTLINRRRPLAGFPHPEVAWTLGASAWAEAEQMPEGQRLPEHSAFPDGGIYVLEGSGAKLVVRCGDVGQNGNGGHAHNDLLSFELSYRRPVLLDSGTYAYTFDLAARNELRSTRAHNTVMVDGEEINPIPSQLAFKLAQVAHPEVVSWSPDGNCAELVVGHDGYRRLPGAVYHRRTFRLERDSREVSVTDQIMGEGEHEVESRLHLPAAAEVSIDGARVAVALPEDGMHISVGGLDGPAVLEEGWIAESYGVRERAPVLLLRHTGRLPATIETRIAPADEASGGNAST